MKKLILQYLKKIGIRSILRTNKVEGVLSYMLYDFLGVDDRYYSFLVGYNATQVFAKSNEQLLLGESSNSLLETLNKGLLSFNTKKAYLDGRWSNITEHNFYATIEKQLQKLQDAFTCKQNGDYKILDIVPEIRTFFGFIVYYSYKDVVQKPIVYHVGNMNNVIIHSPNAEDLLYLFQTTPYKDIVIEEDI